MGSILLGRGRSSASADTGIQVGMGWKARPYSSGQGPCSLSWEPGAARAEQGRGRPGGGRAWTQCKGFTLDFVGQLSHLCLLMSISRTTADRRTPRPRPERPVSLGWNWNIEHAVQVTGSLGSLRNLCVGPWGAWEASRVFFWIRLLAAWDMDFEEQTRG